MPQAPYVGYHFGVFFILPQVNFNGAFKSVSGLDFKYTPDSITDGGIAGYKHQLTERGTYTNLTLDRGFTDNRFLYEWCALTHETLVTLPGNILISLLDKEERPVKNWLIFNAIPISWTAGNPNVDNKTVMMEKVTFSYQNFILI